jgi:hypothetical protein
MPLRTVAVSLAASLALAACGGSKESTAEKTSEQEASPAQARAEIGEVRKALQTALASMREGDAKAADNAVAEGYLQHFEKVEGPLDKVDHELNEKLEDGIREDLRGRIQKGASVSEVSSMVKAIDVDLTTAEQKLR